MSKPTTANFMRPRNLRQVAPGERFDRLVTIERAGCDKDHQPLWKCLCDCGNTITTIQKKLKRGVTRSCGCLKREILARQGHRNAKHGDNGCVNGKQCPTAEYRTWHGMLDRCFNPNARGYHNYGGRGITVCSEWRHSYESFLAYVGRRPSPLHSLDRFPDNNGNYEPGNVRWATKKEQGRNRRVNVMIVINGERRCLSEWAEVSGIPEGVLSGRVRRGWATDQLLLPRTYKHG